jgi:hypothetical protein
MILLGILLKIRVRIRRGDKFNHCARCTDPRPVSSLDVLGNELDLLTERNQRIASQEPDAARRLATLRYTLAHIDPGSPAIHLEIARIAAASGDSGLSEQSRQMLARYAPDQFPLLRPS